MVYVIISSEELSLRDELSGKSEWLQAQWITFHLSSGQELKIYLPAYLQNSHYQLEWHFDDRKIKDSLTISNNTYTTSVPELSEKDQHFWLKISTVDNRDLWLDFLKKY